MNKKQFQFELWEECNSKCSFCYLGNNNFKTDDYQKIKNINETIEKISNDNFLQDIDCLGYIGGEFFQGQLKSLEVKNAFHNLIIKTNQLLDDSKINEVWLSASLLIGNQEDLYEVIDLFKKNISKIWILTSYDTIGRFHSLKQKNDWLDNLSNIRKKYPNININITSIVTGDLIDKYLDDSLDLYQIANKYYCSVFLKPCAKIEGYNNKQIINNIIPNFFPTRSKMLKFLYKYKENESDILYKKLFNMEYRADYLQLYGHRQKFSHRIKSQYLEDVKGNSMSEYNDALICGHSIQYQCYIDSDACLICDKNKIYKL